MRDLDGYRASSTKHAHEVKGNRQPKQGQLEVAQVNRMRLERDPLTLDGAHYHHGT